jgi:hypothetical protein
MSVAALSLALREWREDAEMKDAILREMGLRAVFIYRRTYGDAR